MSAIEQSNLRREIAFLKTIPSADHEWNNADYSIVLLNVGRTPLQDNLNFQKLKQLQSINPDLAMVVISEREDPDDVRCAVCAGAKGLIPGSVDLPMALSALEFVLNGGCYFPTSAISALFKPKLAGCHITAPSPIEMCTHHQEPVVLENSSKIDVLEHTTEFTDRQRQVLTLLAQGLPNKIIARQLGMQEGTVKVHVRFIMRKLGAANRTQVAILSQATNLADNNATKN